MYAFWRKNVLFQKRNIYIDIPYQHFFPGNCSSIRITLSNIYCYVRYGIYEASHQSDLWFVMIKTPIVFTILCLVYQAQGWATCDDCVNQIPSLFELLVADNVVQDEVELLIDQVCPTYDDANLCMRMLQTEWPSMNQALFNHTTTATDICAALNMCPMRMTLKAQDICGHCLEGFGAFCDLLDNQETIAWATDILTGPDFCHEADSWCAEQVASLIPKALPTLQKKLQNHGVEVCVALNFCSQKWLCPFGKSCIVDQLK